MHIFIILKTIYIKINYSYRRKNMKRIIKLKESELRNIIYESVKGILNESREEIPNKIREELNLSKEEYIELYNSICNLENTDEIEDVKLSTNRIVSKEEIKSTISDIKDFMAKKRENGERGYTNEFVVYNPKIEAQVVSGDIDRYTESDVPLVLV